MDGRGRTKMLDNKAHMCLQQEREGLLSSTLSTLYPAGRNNSCT